MTYRVLEERFFRGGMIREELAYLLPGGALADCSNLIFDRPGIARQRHGSTGLTGGSQTADVVVPGFVYSQDSAAAIEELYGAGNSTGDVNLINKTTGAFTVVTSSHPLTSGAVIGRPAQHFGFTVFPASLASVTIPRTGATLAGITSNTSFTNTATATTTANNGTITLSGGDTTTNIKVGAVASAFAGTTGNWEGRVVSITNSTNFVVWPPVTFAATIAIGSLQTAPVWDTQIGSCACSFQGRLLFGNSVVASASPVSVADRRVVYSALPTESIMSGTNPYNGMAPMRRILTLTPLNYFEIPGQAPIVAMEPVSNNELLILTTTGVVIFQGELATQTTTYAPGVTFDISPLNTNAGCLHDRSVQRTPHGIIWASAEGIMIYRGGGRIDDLTEGKIHTYWRDLQRASGGAFTIHGSFYARNHYVVSGTSGGGTFSLCYNLDSQAWGPLTGAGSEIYYGVPRPTDPTQVFAVRAVNGSVTGSQTVRVESMFAPDVAGQTKLDSDGAVVAFSGKSRVVTDDSLTERMLRRLAMRYALEATGANVTVAVGGRLDTADTSGTPTVSVGSLSNTSVLTITGQSNATPIVITTSANHGLQDEDWVDIRGVTTNSNANGRWKIDVLSATTFALNGSSGNGATTSTGTAKKVSEQELLGSSVDIAQGNYVQIASSGTVNRFEWHGFRLGVMELTRGMSIA